jgi:hypothetical protein
VVQLRRIRGTRRIWAFSDATGFDFGVNLWPGRFGVMVTVLWLPSWLL